MQTTTFIATAFVGAATLYGLVTWLHWTIGDGVLFIGATVAGLALVAFGLLFLLAPAELRAPMLRMYCYTVKKDFRNLLTVFSWKRLP